MVWIQFPDQHYLTVEEAVRAARKEAQDRLGLKLDQIMIEKESHEEAGLMSVRFLFGNNDPNI